MSDKPLLSRETNKSDYPPVRGSKKYDDLLGHNSMHQISPVSDNSHVKADDIIEQFAIKRKKHILALICFLPISFILYGMITWLILPMVDDPNTKRIFSGRLTLSLTMIPTIIYFYYNWRCPACRKNPGRSISPMVCDNCGVQLTKTPPKV